jgi:Uma2 family endonuclease
MNTYAINFSNVVSLSDEQFYQLCRNNPDLKFERSAHGDLIIMPPTGGDTGRCNMELGADFAIWNRRSKLGVCFDSSTCFKFPNGADRSPDVSWILQERWDALSEQQKAKFPPIAPDFVLELMSPTDTLPETQAKMREYMENKVRLGWLINRKSRTVEIYRSGQEEAKVLMSPLELFGEDVLPDFTLSTGILW